jgi:hypothetical protein
VEKDMNSKATRIVILILAIFAAVKAVAAEPYRYSDSWRAWNISAREAYIEGVFDGVLQGFTVTLTTVAPDKAAQTPVPPEIKKTIEALVGRYAINEIQSVITDLYEDPSNAFISTRDMYFLAIDKLKGKDIRNSLLEARKSGMVVHRLYENMRRK